MTSTEQSCVYRACLAVQELKAITLELRNIICRNIIAEFVVVNDMIDDEYVEELLDNIHMIRQEGNE